MDDTSNDIHGCANGGCARAVVAPTDSDGLTFVDRRGFIVQSALLAAAAALAACGASGDATAPTLPTTGNTIDVSSFPR